MLRTSSLTSPCSLKSGSLWGFRTGGLEMAKGWRWTTQLKFNSDQNKVVWVSRGADPDDT